VSGWKLTVRHGSDVSREQFSELGDAVAAAERIAARIQAEGGVKDVSMLRDFSPHDQVHARLEISGKRLLRPPTAGVDVRGDGTVVPYQGAIRRSELESVPGESPWSAVRAALDGR
jgi:hypothetical protein